MSSLGPRVWEENTDTIHSTRFEHASEYFYAVAANHANVGDVLPHDGAEELRQPRFIQLHGNDIGVGLVRRHGRGRGAGAGADFHNGFRPTAPKPVVDVDNPIGERGAERGPILVPAGGLIISKRPASKADAAESGVVQVVMKKLIEVGLLRSIHAGFLSVIGRILKSSGGEEMALTGTPDRH